AADTRIDSTRPIRKHAKLVKTGILPESARPAATPIMFCSAMPISKWRAGYFFMNGWVIVDFDRSASRTTRLGIFSASSRIVSPKDSRVALAGIGDLLAGLVGVFLLRGVSVPGDVVLHEGDALALDRLRDEDLRPAVVRSPSLLESPFYRNKIVAV